MISRRALLIGSVSTGAVAALGAIGLAKELHIHGLPSLKLELDRQVHGCRIDVPNPTAQPGPIHRGVFHSTHRRREVAYAIAYPPGFAPGAKLPVCLLLHGATWDTRAAFSRLLYHRYLADAVTLHKVQPFVLAAVEGGHQSWGHNQGDDTQSMVFTEFLPLLAKAGLRAADTDQIAVLGCSMGGYGALLYGETYPDRFCTVVANSPAVAGFDTAVASVDPATPFTSTNVFAGAARLQNTTVRIDCGSYDRLFPAVEALASRLPNPTDVHFAPGCHDDLFWRSTAPTQLNLIGAGLASAQRR